MCSKSVIFMVEINNFSKTFKIICGVPQGSISGLFLCDPYVLPLGDAVRRHGIASHLGNYCEKRTLSAADIYLLHSASSFQTA